MTTNRISIGTVCMNRLHHLKKTLTKNLLDNKDYDNVEFVILDYNSSDGLENWIKKELTSFLKSGVLKYYRHTENECFDRTHSRNMLFKLCSGDIICNVDADNYTGKDFAKYVNDKFNEAENIFLVADTNRQFYFLRNAFGRFCVKKSDYIKLRGLDEAMKSYGSETVDFYERLKKNGNTEVIIEDTRFLDTISHGDEERISNEFFLKNLEHLYIKHISIEESELLFLYKDGSFGKNNLSSKTDDPFLPASLIEGSLNKGKWSRQGNQLMLLFDNGGSQSYTEENQTLKAPAENKMFYLVNDQRFLFEVAKNYSFINNYSKKESNSQNTNLINERSFGKGIAITVDEQELIIN